MREENNQRISKSAYLIYTILVVGILARIVDLEWHFTHIDDLSVAKFILDSSKSSIEKFFVVPHFTTFAPLQFLLTSVLISPLQSYRELLFWGRLPSCIFGIIGIFVFWKFFHKWYPHDQKKVLLPLFLLACSWENIIFAKQMHNYALGVMMSICLLVFFIDILNKRNISFKCSLLGGLFLTVCVSAQYSLLFFVGPFLATIFLFGLVHSNKRVKFFLSWLLMLIVFLISMWPLYYYFLSYHMKGSGGVSGWNRGLNFEFLFQPKEGWSFFEAIFYTINFYVRNFFFIIESNTMFVPREHVLFKILSGLFASFFLIGSFSFILTKQLSKRFIGIFFAITLSGWFYLVSQQRLALSPTRHSLILLPMMAIIINEGVFLLIKLLEKIKFSVLQRGVQYLAVILVVSFLTIFGWHYPIFLNERKDPFDETKILNLLKEHKVEAVFMASHTSLQLELMKSVTNYYHYKEKGFTANGMMCDGPQPYTKLAWISHRTDFNQENYEKAREELNQYIYLSNNLRRERGKPEWNLLRFPYDVYRLIYDKKIIKNVEIEAAKRTFDGANNFYFYMMELKYPLSTFNFKK